MYISGVSLKNFRNLKPLTISLINGVNIFSGNNGQGKTNFLEALYICGAARSHRGAHDRDMVAFDQKEAFITLYAQEEFKDKISVHLKRDAKKGIALNDVPLKKTGELFGALFIIIFSPEDLQLVKGGPLLRRRFMDLEICQLSRLYYYELNNYYHVLKQRNALLKNAWKDRSLLDTIFVWDRQLANSGCKIIDFRRHFIDELNIAAGRIYSDLSGGEAMEIKYKPGILCDSEEAYLKKLSEGIERDIYLKSTYAGIHKDDMIFYVKNTEMRTFGSQGQQRSGVLAAKLAMVEIIKDKKNLTPVLLLDDVLSELDYSRQYYLLSKLDGIQAVITSTGVEDILKKIKAINQKQPLMLFTVSDGVIKPFEN